MRAQDTDVGQGRRVWWPLFAATTGLAFPVLLVCAMGKFYLISKFFGAWWIVPFAATLAVVLVAGLTIPYPRSLWNTANAFQASYIALALEVYFAEKYISSHEYFRDKPAPPDSTEMLFVAAFLFILILWVYATNSAIATWLMVIWNGLDAVATLLAIAFLSYYMRGGMPLAAGVLLVTMAALQGAVIYLILNAHRTVRALRRPVPSVYAE